MDTSPVREPASQETSADARPVGRCPRCDYALTAGAASCSECGLEEPLSAAAAVGEQYRPWLHRFAMLTVIAVFVLLGIGGRVTSIGAGMSVPDWPKTFGYNMYDVPVNRWINTNAGIANQPPYFWEHFHRLMGSFIGFLSIAMALWLWFTQKRRPWLRWTGLGLLALVIVQGLMGGFRVTEHSELLAGVHGVVGQLVLALTVLIAAATSRLWLKAQARRPFALPAGSRRTASTESEKPTGASEEGASRGEQGDTQRSRFAGAGERSPLVPPLMRCLSLALIGVIVVQIALGSWMRHTGAGWAIPDFPANYGHVMPPMAQSDINAAVAAWPKPLPAYTAKQVGLNFGHRVWALVVVGASLWLVIWLALRIGSREATRWPARVLILLLAVQVLLGASVIWAGPGVPEVATLHQVMGAAVLGVAVWLAIRIHLLDPLAVPDRPTLAGPGGTAAAPRRRDAAADSPPPADALGSSPA